jgi:micrococcal nuclease
MLRKNVVLWAAAAALMLASPSCAERIQGKVVGVSDGDTLKVLSDRRVSSVRLAGIDCPEKKQAFGQRAKQFTSSLAFGRDVVVDYKKKDRYGRIIGEVILPDGTSLNEQIVKEGYGWWYPEYSHDLKLKQHQDNARLSRRGLWSADGAESPWQFRKKMKGPHQSTQVSITNE